MLFAGAVQQVRLLLLRTLYGLRSQVLLYLFAVQRGPRDVSIVVGRFAVAVVVVAVADAGILQALS